MNKYTINDFNKQFPDDVACLTWIRNKLYPQKIFCVNCRKPTKHHLIKSRKVFGCDYCGHQISPTANTIFHHSSTSLRTWFYAIYLMSSTRCGISAKQIQRETGVTYKTAWRMFKQIRTLLNDDTHQLKGEVELDETYVGGKAINMHASKRAKLSGRGIADKTPVFGAVERKGNVKAVVVRNVDRGTLMPHIQKNVTWSEPLRLDTKG